LYGARENPERHRVEGEPLSCPESRGGVDDVDESSAESGFRFVLTLIVTTVIVVLAVYVLGSAVLDGGPSSPTHRAAMAAMHAHS